MPLRFPASPSSLTSSLLLFSLLGSIFLLISYVYESYNSDPRQAPHLNISKVSTSDQVESTDMADPTASTPRLPVYFLSIGGPNTMENVNHPAYGKLEEVGLEITQKVKPKAVVVFSAHWQAGPSSVQINVGESEDILYDFYGFPQRYYEFKYPNRGSREVAERVIEKFEGAGIEIDRVKRGLDHGIWAGFIVAFNPQKNPLNVPIIQVSLYDNEDPDRHYRLGQALESLRDEGVLIVGAGMAVHNLQDYSRTRGAGDPMPYAASFDDALRDAFATVPEERQKAMAALLKRPDGRQAHPTLEHLFPAHIVAGAAGTDQGERLWSMPEAGLNWAQYRFGSVAAE